MLSVLTERPPIQFNHFLTGRNKYDFLSPINRAFNVVLIIIIAAIIAPFSFAFLIIGRQIYAISRREMHLIEQFSLGNWWTLFEMHNIYCPIIVNPKWWKNKQFRVTFAICFFFVILCTFEENQNTYGSQLGCARPNLWTYNEAILLTFLNELYGVH